MKHDITELLPFYANGTLGAADRARVEAELAACASCAEELDDLHGLAATLRARAQTAPPPATSVLDRALARIDAPAPATHPAPLRGAWWAVPARYATAATLVVGFGAAAAAAWHAHEADVARTTAGNGTGEARMTTVYRMTPRPGEANGANRDAAAPQPKIKIDAVRVARAPGATAQKQPRLAKRAQLDISVADVEAALRSAQTTVRTADGDVTSLDDASPRSAGAVHGARLEVEVPADRLDATLDALARLGTVRNRTIAAEDVGDELVDQAARLTNLRREERDLRALMDRGGKVDEILTVQQNLSDVRGRIEQLDAQHQHDLHRVATSAIALGLSEDRPNPAPAKPGPTARIDSAWHAGLDALADTVVALVSTIVWAVAYAPVPLALAAIAYAVVRRIRPAAPLSR